MYINPFLGGVIATVLIELSVLFVCALIKMGGKR